MKLKLLQYLVLHDDTVFVFIKIFLPLHIELFHAFCVNSSRNDDMMIYTVIVQSLPYHKPCTNLSKNENKILISLLSDKSCTFEVIFDLYTVLYIVQVRRTIYCT